MCKKDFYHSSLFSLDINQNETDTILTMEMHGSIVNTRHLPNTLSFLRTIAPGVLQTQCFNEKHLPFYKEVIRTEIGHLFEHIVLDELCSLKVARGADNAAYNGRTSWNWEEEALGVFHITIDIGQQEFNFLSPAIYRATTIIEELFELNKSNGHTHVMPVELIAC